MSHWVEVQEAVQAADDLAGVPEQWQTVHKTWGDVRPLSGREYVQAQAMQADVTHIVTTRLMSGANPRQRLLIDDRVFEIESVVNVQEAGRWSQWRCREAV